MSAAATEGNLKVIKLLLNAKANIDGIDNKSPLMPASEQEHISVVKYWLEHGAKYDIQGWCGGTVTTNLYTDVNVQVKKLLILWEKVDNTNLDPPELSKHFQNILNEILLTSISSNYKGYKNLSLEQIKQKFSKFKKQLSKDLQNFVEIKALLKDTPSKSGIFRTFSLERLEALDEEQTSLGGDTKYIFDSEFKG